MSDSTELVEVQAGPLGAIVSAELDTQISTARAYPRSLKTFRNTALEFATLTEEVAQECMYALPRKEGGKTKMIEGPSVRLAEILVSAWGNCRAGARVIAEDAQFVTAQGVFQDLQHNTAITFEVRRRITRANGQRFGADMIAVTANAACSIALRNAVFKGIPKALWSSVYDAARKTAIGDLKTLAHRRDAAVDYFTKAGAPEAQIYDALGVADKSEITLDHLATLTGLRQAVKDGELSIEAAFAPEAAERQTMKLSDGDDSFTPVSKIVQKQAEKKAAEQKPDGEGVSGDGQPGTRVPDDGDPKHNGEKVESAAPGAPSDDQNAGSTQRAAGETRPAASQDATTPAGDDSGETIETDDALVARVDAEVKAAQALNKADPIKAARGALTRIAETAEGKLKARAAKLLNMYDLD